MDLRSLTITSVATQLRSRAHTARELCDAMLQALGERDISLRSYLTVFTEAARERADASDERAGRGALRHDLDGVPLALKDNILVAGTRTTAGSRSLESYTASYNATVVDALDTTGAIYLGKTNLDEFAMGSSTENSGFAPTAHPLDAERVPGGSSGGSAAAVATGLAVAALGSDTGGSIRQPAALCGVVGLKPTYGAVSRSGLIAMASSLDQIGPITKTVSDAAILYDAIRGRDTLDSTSTDTAIDRERLLAADPSQLTKLRIGIPREYLVDGIQPDVRAAFDLARQRLEALGFTMTEISLPNTSYALSCYYIIMPAEVSANLARFDGIRYARTPAAQAAHRLDDIYLAQRSSGFGTEVKRRLILGTHVLSSGYYDAYYNKAQQVRSLIRRDFAEAFRTVDVILTPVTPTTAFRAGEKTDDPLAMYLSDIFTIPVNLAGVPALTLPVEPFMNNAYSATNLPVGFQLIGKHFHEHNLLGIGQVYEAAHIAV